VRRIAFHYRFWGSVALAALSFAAQVCWGSSKDSSSGSSAHESDSTDALNEVVVTAERRSGRLQDVPFTVALQTAADLQQVGVTDTRQLPMVVSGLTWNGQGGWQEPNIRGVYTNVASPGSGNPIAIYLDGVYQASQAGSLLGLPDVSRIEVLKGPQGTLFGRNATGGAIQIFTRDPEFNFSGNVSASLGEYTGQSSHSALHETVEGFLTGPLVSDKLAFSFSASYENAGGYINNLLNGESQGNIGSKLVRGKLLWKVLDQTTVLLTAYYARRTDEAAEMGIPLNGVTAAAQYPDAIYGKHAWEGAYDGPTVPVFFIETTGLSARITSTFEGIGTLTSISAYTRNSPQELVDVDEAASPACFASFGCIDYRIRNPEQTASQEVNFASDVWGRFRFVAGAYVFYDRADEYDRVDLGAAFASNSHIYTKEQALYGEGTYNFTDKLAGVLGVRVDHETKIAEGRIGTGMDFNEPLSNFADRSWTSATPRVSLRYQLNNEFNSYLTFSEGFKGGVTGTQFNPVPPADPERLYSYELGLKYAQPRASASAAVFYYDYRDLQQEFFNGTVAFPRNAASAHILGLDLDGTARLNDVFELRATGSWLPQAKYVNYPSAVAYTFPLTPFGLSTVSPYDASGTRMLNTPKFSGNLTGVYTQQADWGKLQTSVSAHYSDSYRWEVTGRVVQPAYATLNAQISLTPAAMRNLRATVYGKNLTNRAVLQGMVLSAVSDGGFFGPPREVGLTLDYSF
jgi:iron complex outermembrane receptor protein